MLSNKLVVVVVVTKVWVEGVVGRTVVGNLVVLVSGIIIESNNDPSEVSAGAEVARVHSPTTRGSVFAARPILLATEAGVVR